jgi:hypothetical protein
MKNWKTTLAAFGLALAAIGTAINAQFDADPLTEPNWLAVFGALSAAIGLFFAKDASTK